MIGISVEEMAFCHHHRSSIAGIPRKSQAIKGLYSAGFLPNQRVFRDKQTA